MYLYLRSTLALLLKFKIPCQLSGKKQIKLSEKILQRRITKRGHRAVTQVLVKWRNCNKSEGSWEDLSTSSQHHPNFADEVSLTGEVCHELRLLRIGVLNEEWGAEELSGKEGS